MTHRSTRRRAALALTGLVTLALVLAGCGAQGPNNKQNSLRPKGPDRPEDHDLFNPIAFLATVIGILVVGAVIFVAIRYRARPGRNERPKQIHGSTAARDRLDAHPGA